MCDFTFGSGVERLAVVVAQECNIGRLVITAAAVPKKM